MGWCELDLSTQDRNNRRACESGNETSGSIKCGKFLDWLMYY